MEKVGPVTKIENIKTDSLWRIRPKPLRPTIELCTLLIFGLCLRQQNVKLQSSKYKESVKTVKISIINTQLTLNKVMYTTYVWIMSKTATC